MPTTPAIEQAVLLLRAKVEAKLDWGISEGWTGSDFENLSALIFKETGKQLSVTTLKRAWGRTAQTNTPSATTLNILANFVGLDNWRKVLPEAPSRKINSSQ